MHKIEIILSTKCPKNYGELVKLKYCKEMCFYGKNPLGNEELYCDYEKEKDSE
jgi:hypothetical protein